MTTRSASTTSTFRSSFRVQGVTIFNGDLYYTETIYGIAQRTGPSASGEPLSPQIRYTLLYVEFRHLTVFALYRMEIYPAQPMGGSPFRQRQRFRNGEQLEISCKTVFCQPPRFRAACNKSKSELPEFNSAEFGLIFKCQRMVYSGLFLVWNNSAHCREVRFKSTVFVKDDNTPYFGCPVSGFRWLRIFGSCYCLRTGGRIGCPVRSE